MRARFCLVAAAILLAAVSMIQAASAQTLRVALREDPDVLDPTLARTFVGRIVFAGLCDKLFDFDRALAIVPQLATGYEWSADNRALTIRLRDGVRFHDGEPMDAEAVKFTLERHLTMQGSFRRAELSAIEGVDAVDRSTVRIRLSTPFAPLLAQLADRGGMIVSPRAARDAGAQFGNRPVCAGPFRFAERVAQDRMVLERFPGYWDAASIHVDRVVYQVITDGTIRLANLQSGSIELVETINATDIAAIERNPRLRLASSDDLGYHVLAINLANGPRAQHPLGQSAALREAFELAIDRNAINQAVYGGAFTVGNQWVPPSSAYYVRDLTVPPRNLERARALVRESGVASPAITLSVPNAADMRQVAEVIQAMAREAGFDLRIQALEFGTLIQSGTRGEFEAYILPWSGRPDPDGNVFSFLHRTGPLNDAKYDNPEVNRALEAARATAVVAERQRLYAEAARIVARERPAIYLFHRKVLQAYTARLEGYQPHPDGMVRLQGVRLAN